MAHLVPESDVAEFLKRNGWSISVPEGVTRIEHIVLVSEEEFLGLLSELHRPVGRWCYRAAAKICAGVTTNVAAVAPPTPSMSQHLTTGSVNVSTGPVNVHVTVPGHSVAPQQPVETFPKPRREERPADPQKRQTTLPALFGVPKKSFTDLSDESVLKAVKWEPVASGGHTDGSKVSKFRNKFMADFVRLHPEFVLDKETEKQVRKDSYDAYVAEKKNFPEEPSLPDVADEGLNDLLPEEGDHGAEDKEEGEQLVPKAPIAEAEKRDRDDDGFGYDNEDVETLQGRSKKQVLASGSKKQVLAKAWQKLKNADAGVAQNIQGNRGQEQLDVADPDEEVEVEEDGPDSSSSVGSSSRDLSSSSSNVMNEEDLVQKAVNPGGNSVGVIQLKAYLRKNNLGVSGNKAQLLDRVKDFLKRAREEKEDANEDDAEEPVIPERLKRNRMAILIQLDRVQDFVIGQRVIFVEKELDGTVSTMDEKGMYVVVVTHLPSIADEMEGGEEEAVVGFEGIVDGNVWVDEAYVSCFYAFPSEPREGVYPKNHLVLFQRTVDGNERRQESMLEVGWLRATFRTTGRNNIVSIESAYLPDVVSKDFVLFDVFGSQAHVNDVEFKATIFGIEYSDNRAVRKENSFFTELPKQNFDCFMRIVGWAVFTNHETRCVFRPNASRLNAFVKEFDSTLQKTHQSTTQLREKGVNVQIFAKHFEEQHSSSRVFQNTSALAAIMHFSSHRLHLVCFTTPSNNVEVWAVLDAIESVFDYFVALQEPSEQVLSPLLQQFVTKCTALAISSVENGAGEWLAKRLTIVNHIAIGSKAASHSKSLSFLDEGFWWNFAQFERGFGGAVGNFVECFLRRSRAGVGRPSKIQQHPDFLLSLEDTIEHLSSIVADARVKSGVSFKARGSNASARHFAEYLKARYNVFVSRSTVLTYLQPRNMASLAAHRHSPFALAIRPVFDAKAVPKLHINSHYCCSAVKTMLILAQSPAFRSETFCLSIDAKAHVKTGNNVRATVRPVKAWLSAEAKKSYVVADHDFLALKKYCLILNGFLSISPFECAGAGEVIRKGQVSYVIRPWEFRPDSAVQQLEDFLFSLDYICSDTKRLTDFLLGRKFQKLVEISDGGPATKPSNFLVRLTSAFVFHIFSLDLLVRRTNSPETSKLNPVERCHSVVSCSLGGTIPNGDGDEGGMYCAAKTVCDKISCPGLTYNNKPVLACAWTDSVQSFVPKILHDFVGATASEQRKMSDAELPLSEQLLEIVRRLGCPNPRMPLHVRDLIELISDGRHGSATSVDSTLSRCNEQSCRTCGGLWQGKPWVLCDNGSLPMPVPSETPGHYLPVHELIQSTMTNGNQPSWRPSDLIEEFIHGTVFTRVLHDLSLSSPIFLELAGHCCVETSEGAELLLAECMRRLEMHLKRCGLSRDATLACGLCKRQRPCLTIAYCEKCDSNFCASPGPSENGADYFGRKCFEQHCTNACEGAVARFPMSRCADMDWSRLGTDGKILDCPVRIVKKLLVTKLRVEGKWKPHYQKLKKSELLKKVLRILR